MRRALELLNTSGAPLNLAEFPLSVRRYSNGDANGVTDAEAASGILPAGAVLVVGDEVTGDYLVAQGLIPPPATPFAGQAEHTVNLNAAGHAAFILDHLLFTGNDALEILVAGTRSDVFGEIGHDPGSAWTGPGSETTANGVLTLRPGGRHRQQRMAPTGLRFTFSAASLSGFGTAPLVGDPYLADSDVPAWNGLDAAPASDPDADGAGNLLEYAMMTDPADPRSSPFLTVAPGGFRRRLRTDDPSLSFTVQTSPDLSAWQTIRRK